MRPALPQVAGDPNSVERPRGSEATEVAARADRFPGNDVTSGVIAAGPGRAPDTGPRWWWPALSAA